MSQRRLATLVGGSLLALSALLVMSGAAVASNSQAAPAAVVTPSPVPPSGPFIKCGGTVEFTNVPAGWYLVVEPGDHLITSGFDAIALAPGDYTYEFRDAGANDQLGGAFTVDPCSTPTPTPTPTPTQTFNPCASLPIPQAVVTASPISCA